MSEKKKVLCRLGCGTELKFDKNQVSASGKLIPLGPDDKPHQCPNREQFPCNGTNNNNQNNNNKQQVEKFDYNDVATLDKILKIVKHAVEDDSKGFNK